MIVVDVLRPAGTILILQLGGPVNFVLVFVGAW